MYVLTIYDCFVVVEMLPTSKKSILNVFIHYFEVDRMHGTTCN